jgi:hypothetical protein
MYVNLETLRKSINEDEVAELNQSLKSKYGFVFSLRGNRFEGRSCEEVYTKVDKSVAFARVPESLKDVITKITLHDEFTADPPRQRGLYESGTARAELELNERQMGDNFNEQIVRRYQLELVAEGGESDKMLEDVQTLYFGIKEAKLEPKRAYEPRPVTFGEVFAAVTAAATSDMNSDLDDNETEH